jgi:hypothetical protein
MKSSLPWWRPGLQHASGAPNAVLSREQLRFRHVQLRRRVRRLRSYIRCNSGITFGMATCAGANIVECGSVHLYCTRNQRVPECFG